MSLFIFIMIFIGLVFLSLLLRYPYKKIFKTKPNPKHNIYLHLLGWSILVASMFLSVSVYGFGVGITYWFGFLTLVALGIVFAFSYFRAN